MRQLRNQIPQTFFPTADLYAKLQQCNELFDEIPQAQGQKSIEGTCYAYIAGGMIIEARSLLTKASLDKTAHTQCAQILQNLSLYLREVKEAPHRASEAYKPAVQENSSPASACFKHQFQQQAR